MQLRILACVAVALVGAARASDDMPSLELLELLGQWQALAEYGVDIDRMLNNQVEPEASTETDDNEASQP